MHECLKETEIALLKKEDSHIMKELKEIKASLKEFIDCADNKYANKFQVIQNTEDIKQIKSLLKWGTIFILGGVGTALLKLIII